jgi:hypothetical protein
MKECGSEDSVRHGRVDRHEPKWRSKGATIYLQNVHFLKRVVWVDVFLRFLRPIFYILYNIVPSSGCLVRKKNVQNLRKQADLREKRFSIEGGLFNHFLEYVKYRID